MQEAVEADPGCLDAERLAAADGEALRTLLRMPSLPLEAERAVLVREVSPTPPLLLLPLPSFACLLLPPPQLPVATLQAPAAASCS